MISNRFDAIARSVNAMRSRRSLVGLLAGGLLGISNLRQGGDASLAKARKKRKKRQKATACPKARRCGKKCCRGNTRCQRGVCRKRKPAAKNNPQPPQTGGPPVRKNIHSLSAAELDAFARGVEVMKSRPADDPLSWAAQVKLHAEKAEHNGYLFLPWHRMFLYHFEQILRDASGDPTLTLPYWHPQPSSPASTILPAIFRNEESSLYQPGRNRDIELGKPANYQYGFDTFAAMNSLPYSVFGGNPFRGGALEEGLHNFVHTWVDGVMNSTWTSPTDPVFWLHHANIDRLWEKWLRQPGRANPTTDPEFMGRPFDFIDRHGQTVTMTGSQVLDVVGQLNYRYDDQPVGGNPNAGKVTAMAQSAMVATRAKPRSLVIATAPGRNLGPQQVKVPVAVKPGAVARFRSVKQAKGPVRLTLKGVSTTGVTGILYEVHVGQTRPNLNAKQTSYVGVINPFTVDVASHGGHDGHQDGGSADFTFDITRAVASGGGVKRVMVTLVPISLSASSSPPAGPWMTVDQFVVEVNAGSAGTKTKGKRGKPARKKAQGPKAKQFRKRRQQQNAAKRRRLANKRRQQQRRRQAAEANSSPASQTGGDAVNVPGAKHSSFFDLPGTEPEAAATEADHAHH